MDIEFDHEKDLKNIGKHGLSLARASDFILLAFLKDDRSVYGEERYRAWGLIDGQQHCLAFTFREGKVRAIIPKITDKDSFDGVETDIRVGEHRRAMLEHRSRISTPSGGRFPCHPSGRSLLGSGRRCKSSPDLVVRLRFAPSRKPKSIRSNEFLSVIFGMSLRRAHKKEFDRYVKDTNRSSGEPRVDGGRFCQR